MFSDADRDLLIDFEGYGPIKPKIVFVGYEEGPRNIETLSDDVEERLRFLRALLPRHRADKNIFHESSELLNKDRPINPGVVTVWNFASRITAALLEVDPVLSEYSQDPRSDDWQTQYVQLGTQNGITMLTELFPFPRPNQGAFKDTYISSWYERPSAMSSSVLSLRLPMLRRVIGVDSVRYVFMYGGRFRDDREDWKPIFEDGMPEWRTVKTRLSDVKVGSNAGTVYVRSEFFGGASATKLTYNDIRPLVDEAFKETRTSAFANERGK